MRNSLKTDFFIILLLFIGSVLIFVLFKIRSNNFNGALKLDENRANANLWLEKPRTKSEVMSRFGPPANMQSEEVWIWLFQSPYRDDEKLISFRDVDVSGDGFWLSFKNGVSQGSLKSISGNIEEFRLVAKQSLESGVSF